jgi:hypothetical protein
VIESALDKNEYVLMTSLDLNSVFDVICNDFLFKRLRIIVLPIHSVNLISVWFKHTSYYISIDGNNSMLFDLLLVTVQGSILGPVLYSIFSFGAKK